MALTGFIMIKNMRLLTIIFVFFSAVCFGQNTKTHMTSDINKRIAKTAISLFSVLDFDADSTGATDSRAAIMAAVSAAAAAGGGTVFFPTGNFKVSDSIIIPPKVNLAGVGMGDVYNEGWGMTHRYISRISFTDNNAPLFVFSGYPNIIEKLDLLYTGVSDPVVGNTALKFLGSYNSKATSITISEFYDGLQVIGSVGGAEYTFDNVNVKAPWRYGMMMDNLSGPDYGDQNINNCWIASAVRDATAAIYISGAGGIKIHNLKVNGYFIDEGAEMKHFAKGIHFNNINGPTSDLLVSNCSIENMTQQGILIEGTQLFRQILLSNIQIGYYLTTPTTPAIELSPTTAFAEAVISNIVAHSESAVSLPAVEINNTTGVIVGLVTYTGYNDDVEFVSGSGRQVAYTDQLNVESIPGTGDELFEALFDGAASTAIGSYTPDLGTIATSSGSIVLDGSGNASFPASSYIKTNDAPDNTDMIASAIVPTIDDDASALVYGKLDGTTYVYGQLLMNTGLNSTIRLVKVIGGSPTVLETSAPFSYDGSTKTLTLSCIGTTYTFNCGSVSVESTITGLVGGGAQLQVLDGAMSVSSFTVYEGEETGGGSSGITSTENQIPVGTSTANVVAGSNRLKVDFNGSAYTRLAINDKSTAGNNAGFVLLENDVPKWTGYSGSGLFHLYNHTTSNPAFSISTASLIGFPAYGAGTATFDAFGNISSSSDIRLKNIQGKYTAGLKAIMGIEPIIYKWNKKSGMETSGTYAGFSAQNVKANIPLATGVNKDGMLSLQDRAIIAALVNAVKEQQAQIDALKKQIATLKK